MLMEEPHPAQAKCPASLLRTRADEHGARATADRRKQLRSTAGIVKQHNGRPKFPNQCGDLARMKGRRGRQECRLKRRLGGIGRTAAEREANLNLRPALYHCGRNRDRARIFSHAARPGYRNEEQTRLTVAHLKFKLRTALGPFL